MYIKQRILAVVFILASIAALYYSWNQLWQEGIYYPKLATFSPLIGVGGIFIFFFPTMGGRPETNKERVVVLAVFAIGMLAGLVNWFLMDPGFFGF